MVNPVISVILAVFNEDTYLDRCLSSLSQQQDTNFEVIVIDDGSAHPVLNRYKNYPDGRFHFFRINHGGTAIARNFGVSHALGSIIVFIDGDMEFEPSFLHTLTQPITQEQCKGTYSTEEFVANWDNVWARCWNYENGLPEKRRIQANRKDMIRDFRAILKTEFDRVKGFDNIGYTDTWSLSEKLGYFPSPTKAIYYHYNPASLSEAFGQALWIGGRKRRGGILGKIIALYRSTIPVSLCLGVIRSFQYKEPNYLKFKIFYDLGIFGGVISTFKK